jgi:hypothetical protein
MGLSTLDRTQNHTPKTALPWKTNVFQGKTEPQNAYSRIYTFLDVPGVGKSRIFVVKLHKRRFIT